MGFALDKRPENGSLEGELDHKTLFSTVFSTGVEILGDKPNTRAEDLSERWRTVPQRSGLWPPPDLTGEGVDSLRNIKKGPRNSDFLTP